MPNILAVDIGGTNCRLAHFSFAGGTLALCDVLQVATASIHDIGGLMRAFGAAELASSPEQAAAMAFAVAGPVSGQQSIALTNANLNLELSCLKTQFGVKDYVLVNDFMAQAFALGTPAVDGAEVINAGAEAVGGELRVVIGAGTGLGLAALVAMPSGEVMALPSEGGHASFAFNPGVESEFQSFLTRTVPNPYVRLDDVLSGRGLSALHEFLTGDRLAPSEISARHLGESSETTRWFARFYGRACRNAALTFFCRGGLYIAGGIAAKNPALIRHEQFMAEFVDLPQYSDLLRSIPVLLNNNEYSGLWGAARAAVSICGLGAVSK